MSLCIGLMSGTSADGMDACLTEISESGIRLIDAFCLEYPTDIQTFLKALATSETLTAELVMGADQIIAQFSVEAVRLLLDNNQISADDISLIGSHGHTLRHNPQPDGFSWQIGDPSYIAEHTGITCIADFRRRDIAAGGQGAPLAPAFHQFVFGSEEGTAVLNLGGIANITLLGGCISGWDTGPGNALIDEWHARVNGEPFDRDGNFASQGKIQQDLLTLWLEDPYYSEPSPKSTGREYFNISALNIPDGRHPADIAATLTELTAATIAQAISTSEAQVQRLLICGGGVRNTYLLSRLEAHIEGINIEATCTAGVPADWMEAMAFAWLGYRTLQGLPGNLPEVTGAKGPRILGGIYPAGQKKA
ncbi:anhydro-N-acetylmuramic acid kinase [Thalassolituus sp.]|jgi:anhydro-N-acetylmuramic acid kinase|uniref:anhydro-N-acetylmuramic acid kinase n=1 Tax=Thalassolituus sp. TaxID=2030822 RepID=UPI003514BCC2